MINLERPEIQFAIQAIEKASVLGGQVRAELTGESLTKGDRSPVTVGDFAIQALVGHMMMQCFPQDALVAEESSEALQAGDQQMTLVKVTDYVSRFVPESSPHSVCEWIDRGNSDTAERFWTLDPIDGTKGFLRGDHYAVALALLEGGKVQLAVLGCPHLNAKGEFEKQGPGSIIVAELGRGTWQRSLKGGEWHQIEVSDCQTLKDIQMLRSVEKAHTNVDRLGQFLKDIGVEKESILMDSQAKYAALAAGYGDLFFYLLPRDRPEFRMKIWDVAPGALVVEEAGGKISDLEGKDIDFTKGRKLTDNPGLIISNKHVHAAALEALQQVLKQV